MLRTRPLLLVSSLSLTALAFPAVADINLNGFASIRATSTNSNGADPYPGFVDGEIDFKNESLFALQASADLGEKLSATVQLYSEGLKDFEVEARWAYLSYELSDQHRLSAGRFVNPLFHQSEYEKVGYAHDFSRLPKAVYFGFDFSTIEGIALDSQFSVGGLNAQTKALFGAWQGETFSVVTNSYVPFGMNNIMSFNGTLGGDWWSVFGGFFMSELDAQGIDQGVVFPLSSRGITAATANGATAAMVDDFKNKMSWDKKDGQYWFSGFSIDYNNWLVNYEMVDYIVKDSSDPRNQSWFLSLGRRFDKVVVNIHKEDFSQDTDYGFLNGVQHPVLLATGRGVFDAFAQREFDGYGISLRYDFHPSAALKVDYFDGTDTRSTVGDYQIVSIGVDLVF